MTRRRGGWALGLVLMAVAVPARGDDGPLGRLAEVARQLIAPAGPKIVPVAGRVVDADGRPVAGAKVGRSWTFGARPGQTTIRDGATTDAEGRFTCDELPVWPKHRTAVVALDAAGRTGGVALVTAERVGEPVEIRLVPLIAVRVRGESVDPAHPFLYARCRVLLDSGGRDNESDVGDGDNMDMAAMRAQLPQPPPSFVMMLPPGRYDVQLTEPTEPNFHTGVSRIVDVRVDSPGGELDLGAFPLPLSPVAKAAQQPAPPLRVRAARGVPDDVKLADYAGKWVILEFWAHWCGPCVGRGIPQVVQFSADHADARDRFVVLTVHSSEDAPDFAHIDRKLAPIVRNLWDGQPLPFPILIDDDGQTAEAYGVEGIPRTIVINPAGRIAPGGLDELSEALPAIPLDVRVARALDRPIVQALIGGLDSGADLDDLLPIVAGGNDFDTTPDADALKRAGVTLKTRVAVSLLGSITLRSALRLILEPLGLVAVPGPEGLTVTTPPTDPGPAPAPTAAQVRAAERLRRVLAEPIWYSYQSGPLAEVADSLSSQVGVPIVLDPAQRRAGQIDPKQPSTATALGRTLDATLRAWLDPLGLTYQTRDEVILIRRP